MSLVTPLQLFFLLLLRFACNSQTDDVISINSSRIIEEQLSTQQGQWLGAPLGTQQVSVQPSMASPPRQIQPSLQPPPACTLGGQCQKWTMSVVLIFSRLLRESDFVQVSDFIDAVVHSCDFSRRIIKVAIFGLNSPSESYDWLTTEEEYSAFKSAMKMEDYSIAQEENRTLFNSVLSFAANETQRKAKDISEGKYLVLITDIPTVIQEMSSITLIRFYNIIAKNILLLDANDEALSSSMISTFVLNLSQENQTNSSLVNAFNEIIVQFSPCGANNMGAPRNPNGLPLQMPPPPNQTPPPPPPRESTWVIIVAIIAGLLLITCFIAAAIVLYSRTKYYWKAKIEKLRSEGRQVSGEKTIELPLDSYEITERVDRWMISRANLKIFYGQKLGAGAFCSVFKGRLSGIAPVCKINPSIETSRIYSDCEVAVKMLPIYSNESAKADFIREIMAMKSFDYHPHLLCLLGTVSANSEDCLVTEYCARGDLLYYIRERRKEFINEEDDNSELRVKDLISYAWQISKGMDYLCSKGFVHRDLAARNILVDHTNTAKIGDFGLCRTTDESMYTFAGAGGRLPIKWMSIESLKSYICTPKSDVWSYGVLLFELFTLGDVPYAQVNMTDMIEHLNAGNRLDQPKHCPDEIYTIMNSCWSADPASRPSFEVIYSEISKILESTTDNYGYLSVSDLQRNHLVRSVSDYDSVNENDGFDEDDQEQFIVPSSATFDEVAI